jgi:hypothetical protein
MAMATLDFTPLVRSSIGFDQLPGLLGQQRVDRARSAPPRTSMPIRSS